MVWLFVWLQPIYWRAQVVNINPHFLHHMLKKVFPFICFFFCFQLAQAQYYWLWWDNYHQWNGKTPQINYVTRTPKYMGPNALPVLPFRGTEIGYRSYFSSGIDYHVSKDEYTVNPYFHLYFPIQKNRIAFEMYTRPVEYYQTSNAIRDERFMRDSVPKGQSKGDTYFATRVKIWEDFFRLPDLTLEVTMKTTTGKNLENARHINAPAYTFNGVIGDYLIKNEDGKKSLRWFITAGTFIWQVKDNQQDDSFLYGAGIEHKHHNFYVNLNAGGYRGYKNNGDRPVVARALFMYSIKNIDMRLQYQHGFKDMIEHSFHFSVAYKIGYFDTLNKY